MCYAIWKMSEQNNVTELSHEANLCLLHSDTIVVRTLRNYMLV